MSQPSGIESKSELAYRAVRERILTGALEPGAVIQQRALAAELNVSTTPLREAMRRLATEGLVLLGTHRDAVVVPVSADEAADLSELRATLDPLAAALAAERRTEADIAAMLAAHARLTPLPARPNVQQLMRHREFHAAIYRASHNDLLIEALDRLWDKADRYRRLATPTDPSRETRDRTGAQHRALMEHVIAGDATAARDLMAAHVLGSRGARAAAERKPATHPRH